MIWQTIVMVIYTAALLLILLYALAQLNLLLNYLRSHRRKDNAVMFDLTDSDQIPFVTIQLPVYNELYVIERLLDNISEMECFSGQDEIKQLIKKATEVC